MAHASGGGRQRPWRRRCGLGLAAMAVWALGATPGAWGASYDEELGFYFDESLLVEAPTQEPKPLVEVAENVTVVTAADIERMHAHSLPEVLKNVAGVFIQSDNGGRDFSTSGTISIYGAAYEQTLVLLDGVRLNMPAAGIVYTNIVPLGIIDRIEIIKGAASSTWGSALGGVVNIITKEAGRGRRPVGNLTGALGEYGTHDASGELAGQFGAVRYYLFGGDQYSDGILDDRYFDQTNLYGKVQLPVTRRLDLSLATGYTDMDEKYFHYDPQRFFIWDRHRLAFAILALDGRLGDAWTYHLSVQRLEDDFGFNASFAGFTWWNNYDQSTTFTNLRLTWQGGGHTVVAGAEMSRAKERDATDLSALGANTPYAAPPIYEESLALFVNDTWRLGDWTVIPGLRYDASSIFHEQVSPSLGVVHRWSDATLLRLQVARGFRRPPLNTKRGDPTMYWNTVPTPIEPERVWTYQAGVETVAVKGLWLKGTLFRHRSSAVWQGWPPARNEGRFVRQGVELAFETLPWRGIALAGNYTFVHENRDNRPTGRRWAANLVVSYDSGAGLTARLAGGYVWWGAYASAFAGVGGGTSPDVVWDLSVEQRLRQTAHAELTAFVAGHNLFSGSQALTQYDRQAGRWVEAGLRLRFF